jgi:polar amino acid transport system substrate-binding protein
LLAVLLAWGSCATAAEPPLRVMVNEVAPYAWRQGTDIVGMHPSILKALAEESGLAFDFSAGLCARASRALTDKVADMAVTLAGPDQDGQGVRLAVLHPVRYLVLTRADFVVTDVAQLRGKTLGIARGAYYSPQVNDDEDIRKFSVADPFQGVRMLALGRLDAVISSDYLLALALRQPQIDPASFAKPLQVGSSGYAIYARQDLPEATVQRLRAGVAALHKRGAIAAILRDYESPEWH